MTAEATKHYKASVSEIRRNKHGAIVCEHGIRQYVCKNCGGAAFCEHGRRKYRCKFCGTNERIEGMAVEEIKKMAATVVCEFPTCAVKSNSLHADHCHTCVNNHSDKRRMCPECYRGMLCMYHNFYVLPVLENLNPILLSTTLKEYLHRRPFKEIK